MKKKTSILDNRYFSDHKKPVTRREFMGLGLAASEMYLLAPSLLDLLICRGAKAETGMKPPHATFVIDCAGGMAGGQFWLPMKLKANGVDFEYLPQSAYQLLGATTSIASGSASVDTQFGVHLNTASPLYTSMMAKLSPEAAARTSITMISHRGQDDSGSNQNSVVGPLLNYYLAEEVTSTEGILTGLATRNSASGGQTQTPVAPSKALMQVTDAASIARAFGSPFTTLQESSVKTMMDTLMSLSRVQGLRHANKQKAEQITETARAGIKANKDNLKTAPPTDPLTDDGFAQIFGLKDANGNVLTVSNEVQQAAVIAFNAFRGVAQPIGVLALGGFDYHTGNRTAMNAREGVLGLLIGAIASAAVYFGVKTSIHVVSDGGMGFNANGDPVADRGSGSGTWSFYVNGDSLAATRPALIKPYLNDYNDQGGANTTNPIGDTSNTKLVAYATLVNYFNFIGKPQMISKYLPGGLFDSAVVNSLKMVAG